MTDLVVETTGLRKVYRSARSKVVALDGLDLAVPRGGVHGFLGPNGSGKTTTLRLLLGLARPTAGEIRLFGRPVPQHLPEVIDRIGAVVEEPRFTPGFSGRRNLRLLAGTLGLDKRAVDSALEQVGLTRRARTPYAAYSLGMRQRLAIAAALLKAPDLLVLDEPTNGLDPAGIRDIRDLIRGLGDSGVTVLLSSHNLAEVQQSCHSVSIIDDGRLLTSGRVEDLLGEQVSSTRVRVRDTRRAMDVLRKGGHDVSLDGDHLVVEGHDRPEELTRLLAEHDLYVSELTEIRPTLESVFLRLTRRPGAQSPVAPGSEAS
jgi:ABC-2 type transport system ATP-binding protein